MLAIPRPQAFVDPRIRIVGGLCTGELLFHSTHPRAKESRREPPSGWGGFKFMPCFFAEARPLAFKPPLGFFPSALCHAGDLAIKNCQSGLVSQLGVETISSQHTFARDQQSSFVRRGVGVNRN